MRTCGASLSPLPFGGGSSKSFGNSVNEVIDLEPDDIDEIDDEIIEEGGVEKEEIVLDLLNPMVIRLESQNELHSRVSIEPFERGFGYTLGNAIRRVLLSSLPGYANSEAQIDGF